MKALRQLLRVSWTDGRTNDWVLQKAETKPNLLQAIKKEAFFLWTCFKERRKLYGERINTRYNTRSNAKRKTEDILVWQLIIQKLEYQ